MKIAVFTDTYYPKVDGIVTSILNSTEKLAKKGHKVVIFAPKYKRKTEPKVHKNITIYRSFSIDLASYQGVKIPFPNLIKMFRRYRAFKPDIIHIHAPGSMGFLGVLFSKLFSCPCIGTYHTLISEQIMYLSPKRLIKLDKLITRLKKNKKLMEKIRNNRIKISFSKLLNIATIKKMLNLISLKNIRDKQIGKRVLWKVSCGLYNRCNIITVPSKSIKKELIKYKVTKPIKVLSNGIDLKRFSPKNNYRIGKTIKLVHIGRISYEKNIEVVIDCYNLLLKQNQPVSLRIVGEGPALNHLKHYADSLNLKKKVIFTGVKLGKDLINEYHKADIFLTASTMETQGLVVLEAMACGLPVIGVNKFAIPDLVCNNVCGFICKSGDAKKMSDCVKKFIKKPSLIKEFGKKSVEIAKTHELNNVIDELEKIYETTIKKFS